MIEIVTLLLFLSVMQAAGPAEQQYSLAVKAIAARDNANALGYLEAALTADPDNIRYASDYRQLLIQTKQYDRGTNFFDKLVQAHPQAANAHLNYGFVYVDKIPDSGSITQVILANKALSHFSKAIELKRSWIALYTRGNSYMYWPRIFNRTHLAVADLEEAMKIQKADRTKSYYIRSYISLGDAYWKMDNLEKARSVWREGLTVFPDNPQLKARLAANGDGLKALIDDTYDPNKRVDTNLKELWTEQ